MKLRKLLLMAALFCGLQGYAQNSRVQFVHNSPDPQISRLDLWVDTVKMLSNFAYRDGTPFMDIPANTLIDLRIKAAGSTDTTAPLFRKAVNLGAGQNYYMVANGVLDTTLYGLNAHASTRLGLDFIPGALDSSAVAGLMQFRYSHGILDYDTMNVRITNQVGFLVQPQLYRQTTSVMSLPPALYNWSVFRGVSYDNVFNAQLQLSFAADSAVFLISSGLFACIIDTTLPKMGILMVTAGGRQGFFEGFYDSPTGLAQSLNAPGWTVYPNPATGSKIHIRGPKELNATASVDLIDAQGRIVSQRSAAVRQGAMSVERGNLPAGLYLLKVQAQGQVFTSRIKL